MLVHKAIPIRRFDVILDRLSNVVDGSADTGIFMDELAVVSMDEPAVVSVVVAFSAMLLLPPCRNPRTIENMPAPTVV